MTTGTEVSDAYSIIKVTPAGRFDLSLGAAIWRRCQPDANPCREYVVDLAGITNMHHSGVAWLRMFIRWANGKGATVHLVHPNQSVEQRCVEGDLRIDRGHADFAGDKTLEITQEDLLAYS